MYLACGGTHKMPQLMATAMPIRSCFFMFNPQMSFQGSKVRVTSMAAEYAKITPIWVSPPTG